MGGRRRKPDDLTLPDLSDLTALERNAWTAFSDAFIPKPAPPRRWASPLDMAAALDPTTVRTPALEVINAAIVDLVDGRIPGNKLAVFMSPQEGKSTLCSYWTPLWILTCVDPDTRIMNISYSTEMARRWGADVKDAFANWNGDDGTVDLGVKLRENSRAAGRWQIAGRRGGIYCAGINGSITGKAADWISVDDPIKGLDEAQSDKIRKRVMRVWRGAILPRRSPHTKILWIQTLWHEQEPISQILAGSSTWRVVRIPAICDSPDDPLGRAIGEPMASARGPRDWDEIRKDVGPYVFGALYQQRPSPAAGNVFKRIYWRYWSPVVTWDAAGFRLDLAGRVINLNDCWRFITGDLAASTKTSADWTVASAWALTLDGDLVLLDCNRGQVAEADHFSLFRPLAERWKVDTIFLERSQYATALVTDATHSGLHINPLDADTDKLTRAIPASARAARGRTWLPAGAPLLQAWLDEHAAFPNGSHDDMVDTSGYAARVVITQPAPALPPPLPTNYRPDGGEVDFMNRPL